jgi:hypothetical protein
VAKTLKLILNKRFLIHNTTNWVDVLPDIVENYNNSPHIAIDDITPNDATLPNNISKIIEINNEKRDEKNTFINEFKKGDKVRIKLNGFNKGTEGTYSDEIYTVESSRGKIVELSDGKIKKYDQLLKVAPDSVVTINPSKVAKKAYKRELLHKKLDVNEDNIVREKRQVKKPEKLNLDI